MTSEQIEEARPGRLVIEEAAWPVARQIADQLHEPNVELVARIVQQIGAAAAEQFCQEALAIEARDGLLTNNGERRRSPGGVFLYLVRENVAKRDRRTIWPRRAGSHGRKKGKPGNGTSSGAEPPLAWAERGQYVAAVLTAKGTAMTAKLVLIGRPGRVVEAGDCIITAMSGGDKTPMLPKGLPVPPPAATTYVVYIGRKQWNKVASALRDAADVLIVEGFPAFDPDLPGLALFATNVTTKALEQTKRQQAQAQPAGPAQSAGRAGQVRG